MKHIFMLVLVGIFAASCASTKNKESRNVASVESDTLVDNDIVVFNADFLIGENKFRRSENVKRMLGNFILNGIDTGCSIAVQAPASSEVVINKSKSYRVAETYNNSTFLTNSLTLIGVDYPNAKISIQCYQDEKIMLNFKKSDLERILPVTVKFGSDSSIKRYNIKFNNKEADEESETQDI